jgi:hypothetical protein
MVAQISLFDIGRFVTTPHSAHPPQPHPHPGHPHPPTAVRRRRTVRRTVTTCWAQAIPTCWSSVDAS